MALHGYDSIVIVSFFYTVASIIITTSEGAQCGVAVSSSLQRIVGGESVSQYKYPWFAALVDRQDTTASNIVCGGSLISETHVLTAAHCFPTQSESAGSAHRVVFELVNRCTNSRGVNVDIAKVDVNPQYNSATMQGDIAIITLKTPVSYSPICLPQKRSKRRGNCLIPKLLCNPFKRRKGSQVLGEASVIGFGSTQVRARYPCALQEATVKILSKQECRRTDLQSSFTEIPGTICAGVLRGGIDSCDGDSGGPLQTVSDGVYTIQGITSFGEGCGRKGLPGVYTQVSAYTDWIDKILESTNSGSSGSSGTVINIPNKPPYSPPHSPPQFPQQFPPRPGRPNPVQSPTTLQSIINYFLQNNFRNNNSSA